MNLSRRILLKALGIGSIAAPAAGIITLNKANTHQATFGQTVFTSPDDIGKVREIRLNGRVVNAYYANLDRGDGIGYVFFYNYEGDEPRISKDNYIIVHKAKGHVEVDLEPSYVHDYRYRHGI